MKQWQFQSIRLRLISYFFILFFVFLLSIFLVDIIGIPLTPYNGELGHLKEEAFHGLNLIADIKQDQFLRWLKKRRDNINMLSDNKWMVSSVIDLRNAINELPKRDITDNERQRLIQNERSYKNIVQYLKNILSYYDEYEDIYIVDAESKKVIVSTEKNQFGKDASDQHCLIGALQSNYETLSDIEPNHHYKDIPPTFNISSAIKGTKGDIVSVLIMEINTDKIIKPLLHTGEGLGEKGEVLLVNRNRRIITSLKYSLADGTNAKPLEYKIETEPAVRAARGEEGIIETKDYLGRPVLAAYRYIQVTPEWGWGMVVKRDRAELFAPLWQHLISKLFIGLIFILAFAGIIVILSKKLTNPIRSLSYTATKVAEGNFDTRAKVTTLDEVATLAKTFNFMVERIQNWHRELENKVNDRTIELKTVNKELTLRQQEIKKLNANLEKRVHEEVKKNRKKDFIMMHQARLAAMGQMIENIAHQWKQPLNALNILLFNIRDFFDNDEKNEELLDNFIKKGNELVMKMASTIDDFRDFFKPAKKKENFCINKIVNGSLTLVDASFKYHDISVILNQREEIAVWGFPNEYSQVILNILDNAKDAIIAKEVRGKIEINTFYENGFAVVYIKDNAGGIPENILNNIFTPYFTTKEEGKGTGIGLHMSRMIIEEHMNGRINVQNIDGGAEFKIMTPMV